MTTPMPFLISTSGAAYALGVSTQDVKRYAKRDGLACVVLPNGELQFERSDLRQFVDKHKRQEHE